MRENPDGFPSSAGRFATGLLPFRYTVVTCPSCHSMRCLGDRGNKVAAGMNPAADATLATTGLLPFRYTVVTCPSSHSMRRLGDGGNKVAAGMNPAASATLATAGYAGEPRRLTRTAPALPSGSPGRTSARARNSPGAPAGAGQ